ncbi:MAG: tRNA (adenosine(37)-N6)-threonylcarbamoyltransferase complex dimerization subunit type 1 TsaB [Chthoniobacteraceae bacterium]|jgi:tRNA threonylcarbamoyl adenosine modification protein YeaZ
MITLALETSTPRGGVALFRDSELVFSDSFTADRSHSAELFTVIERALAAGGAPDRIVVGLGPGSYAGVRIAISAAIGLSVASGVELLGLPSVAALDEGEYLAIGDARRGSYYFAHIRDGELAAGPTLLTREELDTRLASSENLPIFTSESLHLPRAQIKYPSPDRLGRLAIAGRAIHSRGTLEPLYLRDPYVTENSKF